MGTSSVPNFSGAATKDSLGTIRRGETPRATVKIITHLLNQRCHRGESGELVAVRANSRGGEQKVECWDMATLRVGKWMNDSIINLGQNPEDPYSFKEVET